MKKMITACLDFGNTKLKAGIFENDVFKEEIILGKGDVVETEDLLLKYNVSRTVLSSVIHHDPEIELLLSAKTNFHKITSSTKLNFTTPVAKPESIGADRLALAAAAVHFYPHKNNLIIGLGTCITYNFINQNAAFLGGGISPGMDMRFKSMNDYTAFLPVEKPVWNYPLVGYDTKTNLQSGVLNGMASEIDGIIEKYNCKYGNFNAVLTGGNSSYFAGQLKSRIFADLNLLFKGLYALSELNCPS